MTAEELAAFLDQARAEVDEALARYESLDLDALPPDMRADAEAMLARCRELKASLDPQVIEAELAATEYAGRELTEAEAAALTRKQ